MAVNPRKIHIATKENNLERVKNIQAKKLPTVNLSSTINTVGTKRVALGDLGNKTTLLKSKSISTDVNPKPILNKTTKPVAKTRVPATLEPLKKSFSESNESTLTDCSTKSKLEQLLIIRGKITDKNCVELTELGKAIDKIYCQYKTWIESLQKKSETKAYSKADYDDDYVKFKELLKIKDKIGLFDSSDLKRAGELIHKAHRRYEARLKQLCFDQIELREKSQNVESIIIKSKKHTTYSEDGPIGYSSKLLSEVEDIDSEDGNNLLLLSEYVNDIYDHLYDLETKFSIKEGFLMDHDEITPRMRSILVDWIAEVHNQFRLIPETYFMAINIIDRYLQAVPKTSRTNLQLVGVSALLIATKYEELFPVDIGDYIYVTDSAYTKSNILTMERKMLKVLDFQLSRPLPIHFLRRFSKAARAENDHHLLGKYFIELVALNYTFAHYKPSQVAAASLFLSLQLLKQTAKTMDKSLWTPTLQHYTRYSADDLKPIVKQLAKVVINAPNSKQLFIYKKYCSSKYSKLATRDFLYGAFMKELSSSLEEKKLSY